MTELIINVPVMSEVFAQGHKPEYLYWVGCAGAYDFRYKKVARAFAKILNYAKIDFAVLGTEETCTGDPARRAGNEMLFQMQAMQNIQLFQQYDVKKILTTCPHCYNTLKNEYPDLGSTCEVIHYTELLSQLTDKGIIPAVKSHNDDVTYHDPCYLGRANHIYDAPRHVIENMGCEIKEMSRNKSFALCCGAGGAQFFKESEPGEKEICTLRAEQVLETTTKEVITACPFCITMLTDGLKNLNKEEEVQVKDIAELVVEKLGL
ncbi:MAG TPA: (Fe-S)-binding protein [Bacteroidales bacterium]|jgi:Fe-S oxidoreductase|nr:(Fe-S)-binding protein [Bacteroidales bacterium]HOU97724.1 (Fe-S)-binding protein [Bacteroidales bacterium]